MKLQEQITLRVLLYEGAGAEPLENEQRLAVMVALLERGFSVMRTAAEAVAGSAEDQPLVVLGRFGGRPLPNAEPGGSDAKVRFIDLTGLDAGQAIQAAETARTDSNAVKQGEWKPWFPVIDYDRCTNCMQCLSFCLFGVYGVDTQQKIQVQNNDQCKTNCPACSRVCPEAAIMFPKYRSGPINGDLVSENDLQREKMKIDISALLGGDVYQMLRDRSSRAKSRFSKERDSDKALQERQRCLVKLAQAGDIPPEVLMSLPSPEEIQRRAQEAMQKADAARAGLS